MKLSRLLVWVMLPALGVAHQLPAQIDSRTPPTFLTIHPKPLTEEGATYGFEVSVSMVKSDDFSQMRVTTNVTKTGDDQTIRFREIRQTISPDASQFVIRIDGKEFLFAAQYAEESADKTAQPRYVPTTFGVMFGGGRVGITVLRTD
jgi:hypothetical protein